MRERRHGGGLDLICELSIRIRKTNNKFAIARQFPARDRGQGQIFRVLRISLGMSSSDFDELSQLPRKGKE